MPPGVAMAFDPSGVVLAIDRLMPLRVIGPEVKAGNQYRRLYASIREIGLIEPLMVYPQSAGGRHDRVYTLLDGHFRLEVLKELEAKEAFCLIATDDEAFTYNHKVNRLAPIQEHYMILRALDNGVSEARIAATLNVNVAAIRQKRDLLAGVCPEVVAMLKDRHVTAGSLREIKRAHPMRQIEIAELMIAAGNYSTDYARCLIAATPEKELLDPEKSKVVPGMKTDDIARIEREMEVLGREFLMIEDTHGKNTLNLVLVVAYLRKLLDNASVVKYLTQRYPDILTEFQKLVEAPELKAGA